MSKFVLVETISQYRMRYVIEVPDDALCPPKEYAEDSVTCEEMKEFSQYWIGESIVSSREVDREEILRLCNEDNDYVNKGDRAWSDEQKINTFVTEVGYKRDY